MTKNSLPNPLCDISICICSNRPLWFPWVIYQVIKQRVYLQKKGITTEVIFGIPRSLKDTDDESLVKHQLSPKLIHVYDEIDIGTFRNTVCNEALGKYIALLDDDDYYPEYRIHKQWSTLHMHSMRREVVLKQAPPIECTTVDLLLCYDVRIDKCYWYVGSSESCLFFSKEYFVKHHFGKGTGEGGELTKGEYVMIEDRIEMIIALTHGNNTHIRTYTGEDTEGLPDHGFPPQVKLDSFELDFLAMIKKFSP